MATPSYTYSQPEMWQTAEAVPGAAFISSAGKCMLRTLEGHFPDAISVMKDEHSPTSLTPYLSNGIWHPISQEPVSEPKVSYITDHVDALARWEYLWKEEHSGHGEISIPGQGRWYRDLEDYDPDDGDSDREMHLLGCCGEPIPRKKNGKIVVKPASGEFVTVHDYLSTVHPWLMGLKGNIVSSNELWCNNISEMVVVFSRLDFLSVEEKADWVRQASKPRGPPPDPALVAALANREYSVFGAENR